MDSAAEAAEEVLGAVPVPVDLMAGIMAGTIPAADSTIPDGTMHPAIIITVAADAAWVIW